MIERRKRKRGEGKFIIASVNRNPLVETRFQKYCCVNAAFGEQSDCIHFYSVWLSRNNGPSPSGTLSRFVRSMYLSSVRIMDKAYPSAFCTKLHGGFEKGERFEVC